MFTKVQAAIKSFADPKYAKKVTWAFKVKKGEYAYKDKFIGLRVPQIRKLANQFHQETSHKIIG